MKEATRKHGGYRKGAGRHKKYGFTSSVVRVPSTEKKNIQVQMDMFCANIDERPYNYSASEIYEVLDQFQFLVYNVKKRIEEGNFPDMEELSSVQRFQLMNMKSIF